MTTVLDEIKKSKIDKAKKLILVVSVRPSFRYTQMLAELVSMPKVPVATPMKVPKTRAIKDVAYTLIIGTTLGTWSTNVVLAAELTISREEVWIVIVIYSQCSLVLMLNS